MIHVYCDCNINKGINMYNNDVTKKVVFTCLGCNSTISLDYFKEY